jgi:hypothetical protein
MTYTPIDLSERFPPGTIGHGLEYNPLFIQNPNFLLPQENPEKTIPIKRLEKIERALEVFSETDLPNTDEILRQSGFYDSSDPRCCIRRKTN